MAAGRYMQKLWDKWALPVGFLITLGVLIYGLTRF